MLRDQCSLASVELTLPGGEVVPFTLHGQNVCAESTHCFVVKDAGDDPDVTHGCEVHATVTLNPPQPPFAKGGRVPEVEIVGGTGIGKVTKPGLAVAVGNWAINPVPRQMITDALQSIFSSGTPRVVISIPDGELRAQRTLNARLGIIGGLSILGTTGIVRPVSHQAWTDTLDAALDVALACGVKVPILVTGRSSEQAAQAVFAGPDETYIMMGDFAGYAAEACQQRNVGRFIVAAQFAKLLKIACGHPQTHVHSSTLDMAQLADWGRLAGLDLTTTKAIECANTARQVFVESPAAETLAALVAERALQQLRSWAPGCAATIALVDYAGGIAGVFGAETVLKD
jgi:cobalt-precorrin-5B (C1)-methyltransferase